MIPVLVGREKNIRIAAANKNKAYLRRNTSFFCFYRLSYDQQGRSQPLKAKRLVLLASKPYFKSNRLGWKTVRLLLGHLRKSKTPSLACI